MRQTIVGEVGPVGKQWNCGIDYWVIAGEKKILGDSNEFWERRNYGRKWRIGELWDCTGNCGRLRNVGREENLGIIWENRGEN